MTINKVSVAQIDGDWCGTGRPKLPIPEPKGSLYGGVFALADDYCGNGKIPVPPKPGGGGPWGQQGL
jgi:hypothetical protein